MPEDKRSLKVFLSYASQDRPMVRELSRRLIGEGWIDTWLDVKKLLPGQDWRISIEEAVEESDIVIICLSTHSVTKEGYVQKELRYAREIALEKPEEVIFIIPLRLDECQVPRGLRFYQWVDYFGENKNDAYGALVESLKLRHEQKLRIEEFERARKEKLQAERIAREEAARKKAKRDAEEKAQLEAEGQARQKAEKEKTEREAAEKAAREKVRLEAEERARQKAAREKAERESTRKPKLKVEKHKPIEEEPVRKTTQVEPKPTQSQTVQRKPGVQAAFWVIGFIAVIFIIGMLASNNKNTPQTFVPTSTRTASLTFTVFPTEKKVPSNTPNIFATPSPDSELSETSDNTVAPSMAAPKLYFVSSNFLYVIDVLSGEVQQLARVASFTNYSTMFWLNNSEIAVWTSDNLRIINIESNEGRNMALNNYVKGFSSSDISDTRKIVVGSPSSWQDPSISTMSIDEIGNLTSPLDVGLEMGGYRAPYCMRWSPNSSVVALIIKEFGVPQTAPLVPSLAIIRPGPGESPVIIQRQVDSCISWSPDGKYIAFENEGIFYIDYKSGLVTNVTSTDGYYPVWSPDGNNIAFATRPGISMVDVDTKEETQIYSGGVQGLLWGR